MQAQVRIKAAFAKYLWAQTHLRVLNEYLEAYHRSSPYYIEKIQEILCDDVKFVLVREPPKEISFIIGDAINNLRTSLDYATCALVERDAPTARLEHVQFPFGKLGVPLTKQDRGCVNGISARGLAVIEQARTRHGADLTLLRCISNQDKHRLIVPTFIRQFPVKFKIDCEAGSADLATDHEGQPDVWDRELKNRDILVMPNVLNFRMGTVIDNFDGALALENFGSVCAAAYGTLTMIGLELGMLPE